MYIVSALDEGEECVFRADTVMLTPSTLMIGAGGEIHLFKPSDLLEIHVVEDVPEDQLAVLLESTRRVHRKQRIAEPVN